MRANFSFNAMMAASKAASSLVVSSVQMSERAAEPNSIQARCRARVTGFSGWRRGVSVSSRYSTIAALSNSTSSPTRRTGTLPRGEIFRNQSGLFQESMSTRSNAHVLFGKDDGRALHIGAEVEGDQCGHLRHGIARSWLMLMQLHLYYRFGIVKLDAIASNNVLVKA